MNYELPNGPRLNLGCGPVQPEGWVNIDGSHRAWLASKMSWLDQLLTTLKLIPPTEFGTQITFLNLLKPFPFASDSVSCIYSGEVWEHFEYADAVRATAECYRVLAPGGVLRICVPDGPDFWRKYLTLYDHLMAVPKDKRSAAPLRSQVDLYFRDICTRRRLLGSMGHTHKWQFDEVQLIELFEAQGFVAVERMPFLQGRIPQLEHIEQSDFLIVEGVKPHAATHHSRSPQAKPVVAYHP